MTEVLPTLKKLERRQQDMVLTYEDEAEYTVSTTCVCMPVPSALMRNEDDAAEPSSNQEASCEASPHVGKYALAFEWIQGCSSGIYRFERIYDLAIVGTPTAANLTFTAHGRNAFLAGRLTTLLMKGA